MRKTRTRRRRPSQTMTREYDRGDYILSALVATLTIGAVIFPWHAYNFPDQYGRPLMTFSNTIGGYDLSQIEGAQTKFDLSTGEFVPTFDDGVDSITTASVSTEDRSNQLLNREVQATDSFGLIASDERRALIESADGIYLVGPYSTLPDGSKVRALRSGSDGNQIVTSRFEIIERAE